MMLAKLRLSYLQNPADWTSRISADFLTAKCRHPWAFHWNTMRYPWNIHTVPAELSTYEGLMENVPKVSGKCTGLLHKFSSLAAFTKNTDRFYWAGPSLSESHTSDMLNNFFACLCVVYVLPYISIWWCQNGCCLLMELQTLHIHRQDWDGSTKYCVGFNGKLWWIIGNNLGAGFVNLLSRICQISVSNMWHNENNAALQKHTMTKTEITLTKDVTLWKMQWLSSAHTCMWDMSM